VIYAYAVEDARWWEQEIDLNGPGNSDPLTNWISRRSVQRTEREMTQTTRRKIDAAMKAKIALEALREQATVADLAQACVCGKAYSYDPANSASWQNSRVWERGIDGSPGGNEKGPSYCRGQVRRAARI